MYLKVVTRIENKDDPDDAFESEMIYECDRVRVGLAENPDHVLFDISLNRGGVDHLEFSKHTTNVYLMNADGKTIESYRWNDGGSRF